MIRNDATEAQVRAANPNASTWLGANAGSGKTRVLTDRVARLLLGDTHPEHILCLTFTNAAASEMQNRLFQRLGEWAMLDDDALGAALLELGEDADQLDTAFLSRARTLFARAIETPGGLRIQTIHAFCASILRRFPLEAGVSPQFQEIDDRTSQLLREQILDDMATGPDAHLIADIARIASNNPLQELAEDIVSNRDCFDPPLIRDALAAIYGIDPETTFTDIVESVFLGGEIAFFAELVPDLMASGTNDQKLGRVLKTITEPDISALKTLETALLKADGVGKIGAIPTKKLREGALAPFMDRFEDLIRRVEQARQTRLALDAVERDTILHRFADAFLRRYEATKQARGWLDFDDLITRTRALLTDKTQAQWVLYRLDGGIDHILVDEAQDTSPAQWDVIERLAQEFTAGEGARTDQQRTIFVVGDKKQSIYSFQGADPQEFDHMRSKFRAQMMNTAAPLSDAQLSYSFRSSAPILRLVDEVFSGRHKAGFLPDQTHISFHDTLPGRVDVWPFLEPVEDAEDMPWDVPVDRVSPTHHTVVLANRIAQFIDETIKSNTALPTKLEKDGSLNTRAVHAGDFLILVCSRGVLFQEILKACKSRQLPIAGADKLKVMAELAVQDLRALLSFLATQEDSLSLAAALRSPLFGLEEQDIFDLAHRRKSPHLWEELRRRKDDYPEVLSVLDDLRGQLDFLRPYDLLERVLIRHNGRRKLIGRLGEEAKDGIDALLAQALTYEQTDIPSLTGFLHWMETDDIEIKRTVDSAGSRIRVMTVHGAKGLEAPIVILPDTHKKPSQTSKETFVISDGHAHWRGTDKTRAAHQQAALDRLKASEEEEQDRLLYVALTRAERWLVVAGAGTPDKSAQSWHDRVFATTKTCGGLPAIFNFPDDGPNQGLRLDHLKWPEPLSPEDTTVPTAAPGLPAHFKEHAPTPAKGIAVLSPSDLGGAKALSGADGDLSEVAKERGTLLHLLLEVLPDVPNSDRQEIGRKILRDHPLSDDLITEACANLETTSLADFFSSQALAEVPLSAKIEGFPDHVFHGVIDRLIVGDDKVIAIDFKTNRTIPQHAGDCPEGLLRQMGAYRAMLHRIYPDTAIEVGILWTRNAFYMPLPDALTAQALVRAHHLDGSAAGT